MDRGIEAHGAEDLVDGAMMLAFEGTEVPGEVRRKLARRPVAGFTLFRPFNVRNPAQVRELTAGLQSCVAGGPPLLVAADQEGGQLISLGEETTPFAGNMAIGAAGDPELAQRVGAATGRELRALGVNVNYAPVCDVATDPANPSLGIRAFGDDPAVVARLTSATVRGLQAEGVAATLKHFPGKGDAVVDPHHELPVLSHDRERLEAVELVPFRAGIAAGARVVMVGHYALPRITGRADLPSSLSRRLVDGVLRGDLGHAGVVITDALDMGALPQGIGQSIDVVAALRAGTDLLLCMPDREAEERIRAALLLAESRELLDPAELGRSSARVRALRDWVGGFGQPGLDVVGCDEHRLLARELAERSVTLVRNEAGLVPLRLSPTARIAAIMPKPLDLTPADTSSTVAPGLVAALRAHHPVVDEFVTGHPPDAGEIAALRRRTEDHDLAVVGTIEAGRHPGQGALVDALLDRGKPVVTIALRTPYDLAAYPRAPTHASTYGILPPSMEAVAAALWGAIPFRGRLPAAVPGLYPAGHGIST